MGIINKTFAGSGTVCTGAAARIVNSVVYDVLSDEARKRFIIHRSFGRKDTSRSQSKGKTTYLLWKRLISIEQQEFL